MITSQFFGNNEMCFFLYFKNIRRSRFIFFLFFESHMHTNQGSKSTVIFKNNSCKKGLFSSCLHTVRFNAFWPFPFGVFRTHSRFVVEIVCIQWILYACMDKKNEKKGVWVLKCKQSTFSFLTLLVTGSLLNVVLRSI